MLLPVPANLRHHFVGNPTAVPSSTIARWMATHGGYSVDVENDRACEVLARMVEFVGRGFDAMQFEDRAHELLGGLTVEQLVEVACGLGFGDQPVAGKVVDIEIAVRDVVARFLIDRVQAVRVP